MPQSEAPTPEYRVVPVVSHGQEVFDLIRSFNEGFTLTHVGQHVYTLKREATTNGQ